MSPAAARPSARHRSAIVAGLLAFVLLGFFALGRLPVDLPPSGEALRLNVRVSAPGLTATVIEEMLTRRLETVLTGVPGVASMESVTVSGGVSIGLNLNHRRDIDAARHDVALRLERAKAAWPPAIDPPSVSLIDTSSASMEFHLMSATRDALALRDWTENEFAKRLRELPGVATVDVSGGAVREILVMPDQRRLAGYGLSFEDLLQAIRKNPEANNQVNQLPAKKPSVKKRTRREPQLSGGLAALAAVPVVLPDGESIRLSEVARLTLARESNSAPLRAEGTEVIKAVVHRQAQAALSDVIGQVGSHVDWMRANRLIPDGIEIRSFSGHLDEARRPLRNMGYAFLVGFVLVLSATHLLWGRGRRTLILGVITLASMQGVFIVMASSGVALDIMTLGGLVLGTGLFGGSVMLMFGKASQSERAPVVAAAVAMVVALAPVWFVGGELGALYREFIAVFAGAWFLAALLAWWLVPIFDTPRTAGKARWNAAVRLRHLYGDLLSWLLPRAGLALWLTAALAGLAILLFMKTPEVPAPSATSGPELVLRVQGPDSAGLLMLANDITQQLRALPSLYRVGHSGQDFREELVLRMDEARAHELGVDIALAGRALEIALTGIPAGSFRDADHRYNVRLRLPPGESDGLAAGKILLLGELENRPAVHMRDVATLERVAGPRQIYHHNGKPVIEINAQIVSESSSGQVMTAIKATLDKIKLPSGVQIFFGRHEETAPEKQGLMASGLSLLLIMAIMTLLYRSPRLGLLITLTAGVTLIGTGTALLVFGVPLSAPVWLGGLLLLGISAGHATAQAGQCQAPSPDLPLLRRIEQAARHQFGPLFAMTLTAILGMLALLWVDNGASVLHTLIIVLVTGLPVSMLVNLLLTPLMYWRFSRTEQTPVLPRL